MILSSSGRTCAPRYWTKVYEAFEVAHTRRERCTSLYSRGSGGLIFSHSPGSDKLPQTIKQTRSLAGQSSHLSIEAGAYLQDSESNSESSDRLPRGHRERVSLHPAKHVPAHLNNRGPREQIRGKLRRLYAELERIGGNVPTQQQRSK